METVRIFEGDAHSWVMLARDPTRPEKIIDTNQYLVMAGERACLLEPGGTEVFPSVLTAVLHHVELERVTDLFSSHQDPDIMSSLGLWGQCLGKARLHAPWMWEGFIRHFGMGEIDYVAIPDEGGVLDLGDRNLQVLPAHFLHASGNFHIYDPAARILMSGDVGAALEPGGAPLYVDDFEEHTRAMEMFHRRWMPSNEAKLNWIESVRKLEIDIMAPQHGRLFRGDDVPRFLDWLERLEVGLVGKQASVTASS